MRKMYLLSKVLIVRNLVIVPTLMHHFPKSSCIKISCERKRGCEGQKETRKEKQTERKDRTEERKERRTERGKGGCRSAKERKEGRKKKY